MKDQVEWGKTLNPKVHEQAGHLYIMLCGQEIINTDCFLLL